MNQRTGLILDFGGVLTTSVPACAVAFDRRAGLPEGTLLRMISRHPEGSELYRALERGAVSQTEWNERTGALLGVDGEGLLGRVLEELHPEPSVIAAARAARAAGITVGIFSNSLGLEPCDPYQGYDLAANYDAVLISEHYRARKPDPELYLTMLELMGLPAAACVFVDDTAANLPPAEALGIATIHAQDPAETIRQIESQLGLPLAVSAA
ncbi:HAD-IA family hydrolase [Streptacidiphilus sp. P02-A3a]|uniref:HAD-IA family hydrolase n=1 Tax=Streptacidiphilus sp. P02-A3a TaxID=2704468 RepID=UPI0015FB4C50|nr:HAD-IA family hydrolase [Streptacidiphilus sp. P02-A3a]QMU68059.1 HAD-IA family hydrolase [Streptacidiphilus sp. P02-A3a]